MDNVERPSGLLFLISEIEHPLAADTPEYLT